MIKFRKKISMVLTIMFITSSITSIPAKAIVNNSSINNDSTSVKKEEEATEVKKEVAEVKEEATEVKEEATEVKEEATEGKEEETEVKEEGTEVKEEATEVKEEATEVKEEETEVKEEVTEVKEEATEVKEEATEVKEEATEVKEEATEVKEEATEVKEEETEVKEEVETKNENSKTEDFGTRAIKSEAEPNNTMSQANSINVNDVIVGGIKDYNDEDYYKIVIAKDGQVSLNFSHKEIPGDSNQYWYVSLLDSDNDVYIDSYVKGNEGEVTLTRGMKKGTYYVKVDSYYFSTGEYKIKVGLKTGNYEKEVNNTMAQANPIKLGTEYTGKIDHSSDKDYYKVNIPADGNVSINFKHPDSPGDSNSYWEVTLLDASNDEYITFYSQGNTPNDIVSKGLKKGDYYVEVNSYYKWYTDYKLTVTATADKYYETEFNNSLSTANKMIANNKYTGRLDNGNDKDCFSFVVPYDTKLNIDFEHDLVGEYTRDYWKIELLDSQNNNYGTIYSAGGDKKETINITLKKGTYYLQISNDYYYYSTDKYKISVNGITDWGSHWGIKEIQYGMDKGWVVKGTTFRPDDSITRAEFVKIVNKAFGFTKVGTENYTDVNSSNWFYNEVKIACQAGYIDTKATKFRPNDKITREEVAAIVTTIKKNKDTNLDKIKKYSDYNKVSSWARTSVEGAIENGYMGKNSTKFNPKNNITRAEAIVTLNRIVVK